MLMWSLLTTKCIYILLLLLHVVVTVITMLCWKASLDVVRHHCTAPSQSSPVENWQHVGNSDKSEGGREERTPEPSHYLWENCCQACTQNPEGPFSYCLFWMWTISCRLHHHVTEQKKTALNFLSSQLLQHYSTNRSILIYLVYFKWGGTVVCSSRHCTRILWFYGYNDFNGSFRTSSYV